MVMETRREERLHKLSQALKKTNKIRLKDAAQLLGVSDMTIRRDLSAEPSSIALLGGYIVADPAASQATNYFVSDQKSKNVAEKRYLGQLAAGLVNENDIIFFDCGTTIPFIIDAIADELRFTAVCYSLNTFLALQDKPNCKVILCGGEFKSNTYIFTPVEQYNELDYIYPAKAFISAAGVSLKHGLTCFTFDEIRMKKQAMKVALQNILVVDNGKFDQVRPVRFGGLEQLHQIVTDRSLAEDFQQFCEQQNINVIF